jgi:hypothetical protein
MDAKRKRVFRRTSIAIAVLTAFTLALVITLAVRPSRNPPIARGQSLTGQVVWFPPLNATDVKVIQLSHRDAEKEGIERAEQINLYQMRNYQYRVLRALRSEGRLLPGTLNPPLLEDLFEKDR